ncbi:tol-pal system-associated acyl-CoA thioesterase [Pseudoruegeria sp. SK021]|uniref:tol-pal system-associated acyl-CoA thioesterase n=1 Tax=Pseudoruegeria sp. SK021 TaxID=1933035 RepID=UPI000A265870|nr:tol-pal system-associated acyl-CoA thioesterase [Pseudoruegeria sp. SK021]OSP56538.1 tol-pal system-associated acyl-CoA thioesterase [Pseudoruegeria sp. SK021]
MHEFQLRVYFEDTDLAGIVYYANYLKFIERARSEFIRTLGVDQVALKRDFDTVFAVRAVSVDYLQPARFDDLLCVQTQITTVGGARVGLAQTVRRDATVLVVAEVTLVCLTESGRPTRIPAEVSNKLQSLTQ